MIRYLFAFLLICSSCFAAEFDIGGGGEDYLTLTALIADDPLSAGDIVNIYPATYTDEPQMGSALPGTEANPITIRGVDVGGTPIAVPTESVIFDYTNPTAELTEGHFSLEASSSWVDVEGLCFRNMTVDGVGVAIRVKSAGTVNIKHCLFKDNYMSIASTGESDKLVIEYNEFSGDNYSGADHPHNVYTIGEEVVIQYNYFHGYIGATSSSHIVKSRDCNTIINYNYFEAASGAGELDELVEAAQADGNSQSCYESAKQHTTMMGNVFVCPAATNIRDFVKHSSDDSATYRGEGGNFTFINNTMVNLGSDDPSLLNIVLDTDDVFEFSNNIVYGVDHIFASSDWDCDLAGYNNLLPTGIELYNGSGVVSGLTDTVSSNAPDFASTVHGGFALNTGSPAKDAGYNSVSSAPAYSYTATAARTSRSIINGVIDIGAYELIGDTAPEFSSSAIAANGTTVTVIFNEVVSTDNIDTGDLFLDCAIEGDPINLAYSSGDDTATITLTAASTIGSTDTCTLDYQGGADEVEDATGNDLVAFNTQAVTNNSTIDEVAPTFASASIDPTGDVVTIFFTDASGSVVVTGYDTDDCNLDCDGASGADVGLTYSGGSLLSWEFTPASTIQNAETCNLDCTLGSGDITDPSSNDMLTIENEVVSNNSGGGLVDTITIGGGDQAVTVGGGSHTVSW